MSDFTHSLTQTALDNEGIFFSAVEFRYFHRAKVNPTDDFWVLREKW